MTQMTPEPPPRRPRWWRFRLQWRQVFVLTILWLILVGQVNAITVVGGFLLAWLVTVLFPLPPVSFSGWLHPWGSIVLISRLIYDLGVASFRLATFAFGRRMPPTAIIRVPLRSDSDLYEVMTAQLNTIVPGTIVLDATQRTRTLYLHVFDASEPAKLDHEEAYAWAVERRVVGMLGSRAELAELRRIDGEDRVSRADLADREERAALAEQADATDPTDLAAREEDGS